MLVDQDFSVRRGDSCLLRFDLTDAGGTPLLLSNLAAAVVVWRYSLYEHGPWLTETPVTLVDVGGGAAGVNVDVPTDTTGIYFHECEMNLVGDISTLAIGKFDVSMDMKAPTP